MLHSTLPLLKCPITFLPFQISVISTILKSYPNSEIECIESGFLYTIAGTFFPIINCIPNLLIEAIIDDELFLNKHVPNFLNIKENIFNNYGSKIYKAYNKNKRTKKSFTLEWSLFNYNTDKVWDADATEMLQRFLKETNETELSLKDKLIFDAGCGNGKLNTLIANNGATIIGIDMCDGIYKAFETNTNANAIFVKADIQHPPFINNYFDIVHASGVLIHTNNTQFSFNTLVPFVKKSGKFSVWCYHPRNNWMHNTFNFLRNYTSKLPIKVQYYLYLFTLFPITFIIKKLKGNTQNSREMMVDILDWFSPEFRWEHTHQEVNAWYETAGFSNIKVSTNEVFGFNTVGTKL
jgi:ubiquinone/menaquinone biosynthesis C-methylase UbiE